MRQEIDLAALGPIQTLTTLDSSPPPGDVFDFATSLQAGQNGPAAQLHNAAHAANTHPRVESLRGSYWQAPSCGGGPA